MARVPTYDNFQATPGVRQGRATTSLSGDAAALAGRQSQQLGGSLTQIGGEIGAIAQAEQEKANKIRVNDAYNQAIQTAQDLRKEYGELKGGSVMQVGEGKRPLGDHYYEELNKRLAEISDTLDNPAIRDQFSVLADDLSTRFRGEALAYEAEQSAVYAQNVLDTTVVTSFDVIATEPFNAGVVGFHVDRARDALKDKFAGQGLDAAGIEEQTKAVLGKGHTNVIDILLEKADTAGAKAYFEAHREDFNGADAEMMEAKLGKAGVASKALETVSGLLADMPLRGREVKRATLDAELRKRVGDDPVLLKAARDELNYQINQHEDQAQDAYVKTFDNVLGMIIGGTPPAEIYQNPAYLSLDTKDSYNLYQVMQGLRSEETQKQWDQAFSDLMYTEQGRAELLSMSEEELNRKINDVGPANLNALRKARTTYLEAPSKLAEASIASNRFNVIAQEMGFDPFNTKLKPEQKAELADLRYRLTNIIDEVQRAKGRKLTGQEQDIIIRQELSDTVILRGKKGLFGRGAAQPAKTIMLKPDQVEDVIVPEGDRLLAIAALGRMYANDPRPEFDPSNPENIRRLYLKSKGLTDAGAD